MRMLLRAQPFPGDWRDFGFGRSPLFSQDVRKHILAVRIALLSKR